MRPPEDRVQRFHGTGTWCGFDRLGMLCATGIEVDAGNSAPATTIHVDDDVAFRYFCAAAEQGFVAAYSWLGV